MKDEVLRERGGRWVTYLSIMLSIVLVPLISLPVLAQTTPTEDQYPIEDQYPTEDQDNPTTGCPICGSSDLGEGAAVSALRASRALNSDPTNAEQAVSSAEESSAEDAAIRAATRYGLTELPATGGTSTLWLGVLLVAGGVLTRRIAR